MLGMRVYPRNYIDGCRAHIDANVAAYRRLLEATKADAGGAAVQVFEATFFSDLVLILDEFFVHRLRAVEGKDGNALNEVRLLSQAIMNNHGMLQADKTIKYDPSKSVLKYAIGDEIKLTEADFTRLSDAFLSEIESKFSDSA